MDIYDHIGERIFTNPELSTWPQIRYFFVKAAQGKPTQWKLPGLACEACGGKLELATNSMAAIACMHISIILIDDMLDDDPRGEHLILGAPATANLAAVFQALGIDQILHSTYPNETKQAIVNSLNSMIVETVLGQYLDTQKSHDEATYWQVTRMKSSPFFGSALEIGALTAGVPREISKQFLELGRLYGKSIQIHDDLNDALAVPASVDWLQKRATLPLLFAQIVNHPDRERFIFLCDQTTDPEKLSEAQTILIQCGAVSYCFDRIINSYREAQKIIRGLPIRKKNVLDDLFNELILPVQDLLNKIDPTHPISLSNC